MSGILDQMLQLQQFTPATVEEYIALQLAKGLRDELAVKRYVHYVARCPTEHLLNLFQKAKQGPNSARVFHLSLVNPEP